MFITFSITLDTRWKSMVCLKNKILDLFGSSYKVDIMNRETSRIFKCEIIYLAS